MMMMTQGCPTDPHTYHEPLRPEKDLSVPKRPKQEPWVLNINNKKTPSIPINAHQISWKVPNFIWQETLPLAMLSFSFNPSYASQVNLQSTCIIY